MREGAGKYAEERVVFSKEKRMEKGRRNRRKPESENVSLYATLQEPQVFHTEPIVLFHLHREMHRARLLLPRQTTVVVQ